MTVLPTSEQLYEQCVQAVADLTIPESCSVVLRHVKRTDYNEDDDSYTDLDHLGVTVEYATPAKTIRGSSTIVQWTNIIAFGPDYLVRLVWMLLTGVRKAAREEADG